MAGLRRARRSTDPCRSAGAPPWQGVRMRGVFRDRQVGVQAFSGARAARRRVSAVPPERARTTGAHVFTGVGADVPEGCGGALGRRGAGAGAASGGFGRAHPGAAARTGSSPRGGSTHRQFHPGRQHPPAAPGVPRRVAWAAPAGAGSTSRNCLRRAPARAGRPGPSERVPRRGGRSRAPVRPSASGRPAGADGTRVRPRTHAHEGGCPSTEGPAGDGYAGSGAFRGPVPARTDPVPRESGASPLPPRMPPRRRCRRPER